MGRLTKSFLLVYVAFFIFQLPVHASMPLLSLRLAELDVKAATIGVILGVAGLVPALVALPSGQLTDRIGAPRQAAVGSVACAAGFAGLNMVASPLLVTVFTALMGLGHTIGVVAYQSFVAATESAEERVQAFGWLAAMIAAAQSIGPGVAGALADRFSLTAVFGLAAGLIAFSLVGVPVLYFNRGTGAAAAETPSPADAEEWWRDASLLFAIGATLMFAFSYSIRHSYLPLYLESIGQTTTEIGLIFSAQAVSSLLIRSRIGKLVDWLGQRRTLLVTFVLSVPVLALIPLLQRYELLLALAVLLGLGNGIMHPVTLAVTTTSISRERRGSALGLRYATFRMGIAVSPILLAGAVALAGLPAAFIFSAVFAAIGAVNTWRNPEVEPTDSYVKV